MILGSSTPGLSQEGPRRENPELSAPCITNRAESFLCAGDVVTRAGYLVPALRLSELVAAQEQAREVPRLQGQRDLALARVDELVLRERQALELVQGRDARINELHVEMGALLERPTWWSVIQWSFGGLGLGLILGAVVGALAL